MKKARSESIRLRATFFGTTLTMKLRFLSFLTGVGVELGEGISLTSIIDGAWVVCK